ncbi:DUF6544 family protein [Halomicrobium urmianum]|uniref:DUF6544 family protein n=1 Tax=Halomicrobium urmianum TaxID=1586233 RepID=UPI001CDA3DB8|nr:DUF6544 family protein [Halomicrobium urmianum]
MGSSPVRRSLVGLGLLASAVAVGKVRLDRSTARRVAVVTSAAATEPHSDRTFEPDAVAHLPDPVRRYFETVLEAGRTSVASVRLEQRGEFRLGGRSGSWKPMRATQHYGVDPPGFVWDATIDVAPLVPVRVVDAYERGHGSLRACLLSTIPVADADPGPEMNEAELQRYLAEAVWFPTALLPGAGVEWAAVDDRSARATLRDRGTTASLVFHFDDDGLVERVTAAERYRQEDDDYAPWTGRFGDYQRIDGRLIPTEASVEWNLPDGNLPYWRAVVTTVEHQTG